MRLASIRQIALGTVFAATLMGCASERPELTQAESTGPGAIMAGSSFSLDVDAGLARAQAERHDGELETASQTLARLMLVAPDDPQVLGEYGKTLIAEGRSHEALGFLERAVELDPGDWSLHSAKGVAYDLMGDHLEAQSAYERALAVKPGEPTVLSNNAMSHMEAGDFDTAERLLMEASQTGADPRIKQNLAMVQSKRSARTPSAPAIEMTAVVDAADAAPQPNMGPTPDVSPLMETAAAVAVAMAAPDLEPQIDARGPLEEDQATRGQSIAFDATVGEEPSQPPMQPAKAASPKADRAAKPQAPPQAKVAVAASKKGSLKAAGVKTAKANAPSKKPASTTVAATRHATRPDEMPVTQTASGK
jgi:Flp pilus assembly protein TadD